VPISHDSETGLCQACGVYPLVACPHCGRSHMDKDGFGVLICEACGWCSHVSISGDVCGLCGKTVEADDGV